MDFLNDYNGQIMEEDIDYIKNFLTNILDKKGNDKIIYYLEMMLAEKRD